MTIKRILLSLVLLLAVVAIAPTSASAQETDPWFVDETTLPFEPAPGTDAQQYWGVLGDAGYRVEVPADWNGELVMWAHGFRGEGPELTVDNHPQREHLLSRGFAWAASSYETNGYNVRTGVDSTKALADYVDAEILPHQASRIYITGASMGGHITARSIEDHPRYYAGAMPICGVLGDFELFNFFTAYNLVAQQLVLGDSTFPVEPGTWFGETVPTIKDGLAAQPGSFPFALSETGEQFKQFMENATGGDRPNFDEAFLFWHGFPTATGSGNFFFDLGAGDGTLPNSDGGVVLDNNRVRYQLDTSQGLSREERQLNNDIFRVTQDQGARNVTGEGLTGHIKMPVMSLHNLGDLFVPFSMEQIYADDVKRQGKSRFLVQRAIRGSGHCDFTPYELNNGFDDLTDWVETGKRPAGDKLTRQAVSREDYGCQFSDPDNTLHSFATPCP